MPRKASFENQEEVILTTIVRALATALDQACNHIIKFASSNDSLQEAREILDRHLSVIRSLDAPSNILLAVKREGREALNPRSKRRGGAAEALREEARRWIGNARRWSEKRPVTGWVLCPVRGAPYHSHAPRKGRCRWKLILPTRTSRTNALATLETRGVRRARSAGSTDSISQRGPS